MALKKTTLLFDEDVYEKLKDRAKRDNASIGALVREAVATYYGIKTREDKIKALERLRNLSLPVNDPDTMEDEIIKGVLNDR